MPRHDVPAGGGRSGFTLVEGRQVHYLEWGHGGLPPVLCLHGGGQTAYMYEELGAAVGGRYHVIAPDLPAHGDSDAVPDMDRHVIAATIPPLLDHFGLARPAFVGASLGGVVSITVGAAHPERVAAVALIDIGHQLEEDGVLRIIEFLRAHESFGSLDEAAAAIREYLPQRTDVTPQRLTRNLRQREDGRWVWKHGYGRALRDRGSITESNWQSLLEGVEGDARELACPVLLIRGARSDVLSDEGADAFVKLIPDARLATVDAAGHLAVGDNPRSTVSLIADFLDEVI
ncbi:MAG: alpha/beta hydrolase [Actinobacteria bacterium]|nr:alpha/beta hydrolase [Actinomycetota bacterium]